MTFQVKAIPEFEKELKKLLKKYPSLKDEFLTLVESLETNPNQGVQIFKNCFKIRIAIKSKGKGKSGGGRVITHIAVTESIVFLLSIYDKSKQESITDAYIKLLLEQISDK
jgi:mRNA-degrading endonuclease RelE of RelBE toxin-antitoxin system